MIWKSGGRSKSPRTGHRNQERFKVKKYTFVYIPEGTGTARKFQVPKYLLVASAMGLFVLLGAIAALGMSTHRVSSIVRDNQRLKAENASIRSEAAALVARLQDLQQNLSQVNRYSKEVKEVTKEVSQPGNRVMDSKGRSKPLGWNLGPNRKGNNPSKVAIEPNIGPVSPAEFEQAKKQGLLSQGFMPGEVKEQSLEFKDLFSVLTDLKWSSAAQLQDLRGLLTELQQYRTRLNFTPTLSPVSGMVSSLYGLRSSPINGEIRMHQGLDIAAPLGTPIKAAASGVVQKVAEADDYGKYVEIKHSHGLVSRYAHARLITVKVGNVIEKGQKIGEVGMTGRTTGPHLHYELSINGKKVDPANFIRSF
jgi:murein DD-endopeptidase MepM/ murein hydrolase activator NlpD